MGKELPLARSEEEGRSVLLAITSSGELITTSYSGDKREKKSAPTKVSTRGAIEDTKAKSKRRRKVEGTNASSSKEEGSGRDYQDRESDRGDEREDKPVGRSAQELGIVYPVSYCDDAKTIPHQRVEVDKVYGGSLSQCKLCHDYLWLPLCWTDAQRLDKLIMHYGRTEGYCRFLNKRRGAKMLMAKLQDLRRLAAEITDKRKFARVVDKILSDKDYDRKEAV